MQELQGSLVISDDNGIMEVTGGDCEDFFGFREVDQSGHLYMHASVYLISHSQTTYLYWGWRKGFVALHYNFLATMSPESWDC